jgi:hypothetical protein
MIRALITTYAGCKFRSRAEARWALFFDAVGIRFQYEFEGFLIRAGAYLPDFWLPELRLFFEVKGDEPSGEERAKCAEVAIASECDMLLAVGNPEERFQLFWFDRDGEREDRYVLARDRMSDCGFWLVAEDGANWIGPDKTKGKETPRGPMLSGALEDAYAAARSARFERGSGKVRQSTFVDADPDRVPFPSEGRAA